MTAFNRLCPRAVIPLSGSSFSFHNVGDGYARRGYGRGLAAGALVGGAVAGSAYYYGDTYGAAPVYAEPDQTGSVDNTAYCVQRFRSYEPGSGTYLGYDRLRHPCP